MKEPKVIDAMNYEEAYAELERIVAALESGEQALEEATAIFGRGQALVKHCAGLLEKAELKVRVLSGEDLMELEGQE